MSFGENTKEKISIEIIKTLVRRFELFPEDATTNRNAPFHEAFLKAFTDKLEGKLSDIPFLLSLKNWLHGLVSCQPYNVAKNITHVLHTQSEMIEYEEIHRDTCQRGARNS